MFKFDQITSEKFLQMLYNQCCSDIELDNSKYMIKQISSYLLKYLTTRL
jgi:hypothetical protein